MQLVHFALTQILQHRLQIDLSVLARQGHHLGTTALQRADGLGVAFQTCTINKHFAGHIKQLGRWWRAQLAVHNHQPRLARRVDVAHIEQRVVAENRADAGQNRAGPCPPMLAIGPRRIGGNPLAFTVVQRRRTVQRHSRLEPDPRLLAHHAAEKTDIQFSRLRAARSRVDFDIDASRAQSRKAIARHARIRIGNSAHHLADASRNQRIAARPRAALVRAGLERDIGRRAAHIRATRRRIAQRHHLGMRAARLLREATAQLATAVGAHDHAADARVRVRDEQRIACQRKRALHGVGGRCGVGVCCIHGMGMVLEPLHDNVSDPNIPAPHGSPNIPRHRAHPRASASNRRRHRCASARCVGPPR